MPTSLGATRLVEWPSNLLIPVSDDFSEICTDSDSLRSEMLTPIDQPLDKLDDLTPEEM